MSGKAGSTTRSRGWIAPSRRFDRTPSPPRSCSCATCEAIQRLGQGRLAEALAAFVEAQRLQSLMVTPDPLAIQARGLQVQTLVRMGDVPAARAALAAPSDAEREYAETRAALAAIHWPSGTLEAPSRTSRRCSRARHRSFATSRSSTRSSSTPSRATRSVTARRRRMTWSGRSTSPSRTRSSSRSSSRRRAISSSGTRGTARRMPPFSRTSSTSSPGRRSRRGAASPELQEDAHRERDPRAPLPPEQPVGARDRGRDLPLHEHREDAHAPHLREARTRIGAPRRSIARASSGCSDHRRDGSLGRPLTRGAPVVALTRSGGCALIPPATTLCPWTNILGRRTYVIRIRGVLSDRLLTAFPGLRVAHGSWRHRARGRAARPGRAARGPRRIEALGLELLEVRRSRR